MRLRQLEKGGGPRQRKSDAIKELERLDNAAVIREHPHCDPRFLAPRWHNDVTTSDLTRCVKTYLRLLGQQCERTGCQGRVIDQTKNFVDVLGHGRTIGSVKWIPTSGTRGTADLSCVIFGKAVKIELKKGPDKLSEFQVKYQQSIEAAGGIYLVISTFQQFFDWYQEFIK